MTNKSGKRVLIFDLICSGFVPLNTINSNVAPSKYDQQKFIHLFIRSALDRNTKKRNVYVKYWIRKAQLRYFSSNYISYIEINRWGLFNIGLE